MKILISLSVDTIQKKNMLQALALLQKLGCVKKYLKFFRNRSTFNTIVFAFTGEQKLLLKFAKNKLLQANGQKQDSWVFKDKLEISIAYTLGETRDLIRVDFPKVGSVFKKNITKPAKVKSVSLIPFLESLGIPAEQAEELGGSGIRFVKGAYTLQLENTLAGKELSDVVSVKMGQPDKESEEDSKGKPTGNRSHVWSLPGKGLVTIDYNKNRTCFLSIILYKR